MKFYFMKLLYFEWRKFIFRKHVFIFLLLLSLLDISKLVLDKYQGEVDILSIESPENRKGFDELYNMVKGSITEEKIQFLEQEKERLEEIYGKKLGNRIEGEKTYTGNLYEDYRILKKYIYIDFERCAQYEAYSSQLEQLAKENVAFYEKMNNIASKKQNEFIARTYNNRKINAYYRTEGLAKYFRYMFSSILMVFMCFLGVAPMYVSEKEIHMQDLLKTTCIGRISRKTVKLFAAMLYGAALVVWFRLLDYVSFWLLFGIEGTKNPIWSVSGFEKSPLNCSIQSYILYDIGIKILSVCVIVLTILLLSFFMDKIIHVAIGSAILLGIWQFMEGGINSLHWVVKGCAMCSPLLLMNCSRLFCEFLHIEAGRYFIRGEVLSEMAGAGLVLVLVIFPYVWKGRGSGARKHSFFSYKERRGRVKQRCK